MPSRGNLIIMGQSTGINLTEVCHFMLLKRILFPSSRPHWARMNRRHAYSTVSPRDLFQREPHGLSPRSQFTSSPVVTPRSPLALGHGEKKAK